MRPLRVAIHRGGVKMVGGQIEGPLKFGYDILERILRNFNVTYVLKKGTNTGIRSPNGSYSGLIGILQRNEIDLSTFDIKLADVYTAPVHFGPPLGPHEMAIYSKTPPSYDVDVDVLDATKAFDNITLSLMAVVIILFVPIITALKSRSNVNLKSLCQNIWVPRAIVDSLVANVWLTFQILANQSNAISGIFWARYSALLFVLLCYIMTIVFMNQFSANLVFPVFPHPIDSLEDLARSTTVKPLFTGYDTALTVFNVSTNRVYNQIYQITMSNRADCILSGKGVLAHLRKVILGKLALIDSLIFIEFIRKTFCVLEFGPAIDTFREHVASEGLPESIYVNMMSPNLSREARKLLNTGLRQYLEFGLFFENNMKMYDRRVERLDAGKSYFCLAHITGKELASDAGWRPASVNNLKSTFFFGIYGLCGAVFVLVMEIISRLNICIKVCSLFKKLGTKLCMFFKSTAIKYRKLRRDTQAPSRVRPRATLRRYSVPHPHLRLIQERRQSRLQLIPLTSVKSDRELLPGSLPSPPTSHPPSP